jgi:hypothetical protein
MSLHKTRILTVAIFMAALVAGTLAYGLDYYRMGAADRVFSEKHDVLRPSGSVGLRLGMLGVGLFFCLYAYPIRKRWRWLQRFGKTKNWLDFHILMGISVPAVITLHSSFKFQGLAGVAYWLMMAVVASGFIGRYIYAQIPKSLNETALTLDEIEKLSAAARDGLSRQRIIPPYELGRVLMAPDAAQVEQMSMMRSLMAMLWGDLRRPFQTARLRRAAAASLGENLRTLFGLFPSSNAELEDVVHLVRRQSRLVTKVAFLGRANQIFQLWHVVHRPFSYSFAVLAAVHVGLVMLMGYF